MKNIKLIKINTVSDQKGQLSFFESQKNIEFDIKRIYYIYNAKEGVQRGFHAHKQLKQFLFCPSGSVKLFLDNGFEKSEIILDSPTIGLQILPCVWREFTFLKQQSVLIVAASEYYQESDYIRNYDMFLNYIKEYQNED
ncbi:MAG: FdtA/QdtA family cupin domain-containing protein [Acholeplasma sp.]|jgi:dTDP-4-dehydrorhamnose 3,5-epimerase-like enzyme|nr:FdtA/QdtA family cupin domain-containing protein [Acholeplasma sp.]